MVSNIFHFHPCLGKIPILTHIFQLGWNHQTRYMICCFYMYLLVRTNQSVTLSAEFMDSGSIWPPVTHWCQPPSNKKSHVLNPEMEKIRCCVFFAHAPRVDMTVTSGYRYCTDCNKLNQFELKWVPAHYLFNSSNHFQKRSYVSLLFQFKHFRGPPVNLPSQKIESNGG